MEAAAGAPAALPSTPGSPALETSSAAAAQSSPPYPALAADLDDLFCAECLAIDDAWLAEVRKTRQGWVPTAVIAVHLARLFGRPGVTAADVLAASHGSDVLTASEDGAALRKKHPLRRISFPDTQSRTGAWWAARHHGGRCWRCQQVSLCEHTTHSPIHFSRIRP